MCKKILKIYKINLPDGRFFSDKNMVESPNVYNVIETEAQPMLRSVFYPTLLVDVDSCTSSIEGIDLLAKIHGKEEEVAVLTRMAMNGEVAMDEIFERRLQMIGVRKEDLKKVAYQYLKTITADAFISLSILKASGVDIWFLSGGYDESIFPLAEHLGISKDHVFANTLFFEEDGNYAGFDRENPLWQKTGKKKAIDNLKREGRIKGGRVAIIGDAVSEAETAPVTDLRIGFGGHQDRQKVREMADVFVKAKTFLPLLPLVLGAEHFGRASQNSGWKEIMRISQRKMDEVIFNSRARFLQQELKSLDLHK